MIHWQHSLAARCRQQRLALAAPAGKTVVAEPGICIRCMVCFAADMQSKQGQRNRETHLRALQVGEEGTQVFQQPPLPRGCAAGPPHPWANLCWPSCRGGRHER